MDNDADVIRKEFYREVGQRTRAEHELRIWQSLKPWLRHVGNCGAFFSDNPIDDRCLCGLRQAFWPLHVYETERRDQPPPTGVPDA